MPIGFNPETGEALYLADDGQWAPAKTAVDPQSKETLVFDGKSWIAPVPKARSLGQLADDAARSVASGVTLGFADEIAAAADTTLGTGAGKLTYEENLAAQQARDKEIPPQIKMAGEVAGAAATAPLRAPALAATGLSKLPPIVRNIGGGAAGGAGFGAGEAEPGERVEGAVKGAGMGGAVGAAVPAAASAASKTVSAVKGAVSPEANVAADLARAIRRDQTTPDAVQRAAMDLAATRPGVATLADAGGENVRGLVERIAQTPGAGRTVVIPNLTNRQQGQMLRIARDLSDLTGTGRSAAQAVQETMKQRAEASRPLYDEAFNFNARSVPEVVKAWTEATSTGWGRAILMRPDFRKTLQTEYGIADANNAPLMVVIDAWKKQADDMIGNAIRSGNANQARVLSGMRDRVLETVDNSNPAYAQARGAWAGPSRYLDAIEEGRNIFNTKIGAEELTAAIGAMSEAEREAFRVGAVSAIRAKMGSDPAKLGDMSKYLRSPEMRAKVAAIMPTAEARETWAKRLDFEVSSSELTGRSLGNSATARRLAERQDADSIVGDLVMDAFTGSPPVSLLRRFVTAVPQRIRDTLRSRSDQILAELLTDPQSMAGLRKAIERVESAGKPPSVLRNPALIRGANAAVIGE